MEAFQTSVVELRSRNWANEKPEAVQVATLLTVIGEEAREVFSTFGDWASEGDEAKLGPVLPSLRATASRGRTSR